MSGITLWMPIRVLSKTADIRKKGWPNKKIREAFQEKWGK